MSTLYEFWVSDNSTGAIEISGHPAARFFSLHEKNSTLLYRKDFSTYKDFKAFYNEFYFEGLNKKLPLLNIPGSNFLLHKYLCGLKAGQVVRLSSGFIQQLFEQEYNFLRRVGWLFTVVPGDKDYPHLIWLKTHKGGSQQKFFPILEENIGRFVLVNPDQ